MSDKIYIENNFDSFPKPETKEIFLIIETLDQESGALHEFRINLAKLVELKISTHNIYFD